VQQVASGLCDIPILTESARIRGRCAFLDFEKAIEARAAIRAFRAGLRIKDALVFCRPAVRRLPRTARARPRNRKAMPRGRAYAAMAGKNLGRTFVAPNAERIYLDPSGWWTASNAEELKMPEKATFYLDPPVAATPVDQDIAVDYTASPEKEVFARLDVPSVAQEYSFTPLFPKSNATQAYW
jgi:hypothetical protein